MSIWLDLATSLEASKGPDIGLDYEIWDLAFTGGDYEDPPRLTASIDAIASLTKRELPDIGYVATGFADRATFRIEGKGFDVTGIGKTEPLARCAAFCLAMASKYENGAGNE